MREGKITVVNRLGLHARAAAKLVGLAKTFSSQVELTRDAERVDGKSIMSVMLLAAPIGTELVLHVSGPDEDEAFDALEQLVADRFGEGE